MADTMKIRIQNTRAVIEKLKLMRQDLSPDSPAVKRALIRMAILITSQAKLNIRRHGLIDTSRLINSLRWEFYKRGDVSGILIGSFGVPYAAFWEFGYNGTMQVRAHNRLITQAFGKTLKESKVVRVTGHARTRNQTAKPYLSPAYEKHKGKLAQILSDTIGQ